MFAAQRLQCLDQISWNAKPANSRNNDSVTVLECFKTAGLISARENVDYRLLKLAQGSRDTTIQSGATEATLDNWLQCKGRYAQPAPVAGVGTMDGGMRVIFCDRPGPKFGMSISKAAFLTIEAVFNLHLVTLPSFLVNGGTMSMFRETGTQSNGKGHVDIIVKACQKAELGNWLVSLSHDTATGWTNAFVCGDGVLYDSPEHRDYFGSQLEQLVSAIINSPSLWNNPIFLPALLLQIYSERTQVRLWCTDNDLLNLENQLGVTNADRPGLNVGRKDWPQNIDPKVATKSLHSVLTHIIYMTSCSKWLCSSTETLLRLERELQSDDRFRQYRQGFCELRESILYISSVSKTFDQYFSAYKERATVQANVLFSIVSQQEGLLSRWDSQLSLDIARASKRDSISMTTFTFITAIFLPSTFVATLFSMSMFNWQPSDNSSATSQVSNVSSSSYASSSFWIFWAVAVPLTLLTFGAWFLWFRYASRKWEERFRVEPNDGAFPLLPVPTQPIHSFNFASDHWSAPKQLFKLT